jgi:hypothetical protein
MTDSLVCPRGHRLSRSMAPAYASDGFKCDACRAGFATNQQLHCAICHYDLSNACERRLRGLRSPQPLPVSPPTSVRHRGMMAPTCSRGGIAHDTVWCEISPAGNGWNCDLCDSRLHRHDEARFRCVMHDFDVCARCAGRVQQESSPAPPLSSMPTPSSDLALVREIDELRAQLRARERQLDAIQLKLALLVSLPPNEAQSNAETRQSAADLNNCVVCDDAQRSTALVPCGHVCCCGECAVDLRQCPICREAIRERLKLFFA